jgi:hypothetical protein
MPRFCDCGSRWKVHIEFGLKEGGNINQPHLFPSYHAFGKELTRPAPDRRVYMLFDIRRLFEVHFSSFNGGFPI